MKTGSGSSVATCENARMFSISRRGAWPIAVGGFIAGVALVVASGNGRSDSVDANAATKPCATWQYSVATLNPTPSNTVDIPLGWEPVGHSATAFGGGGAPSGVLVTIGIRHCKR